MPRGGKRPGAGRPPKKAGDVGKPVLAKRLADVERKGQKLAVDVLSDMMNFFFGKAAFHQPVASNSNANEKQFIEFGLKAADMAGKLAPYQTPRLESIKVQQLPLNLGNLTDKELAELERLHAKAALADGDQAGAAASIH